MFRLLAMQFVLQDLLIDTGMRNVSRNGSPVKLPDLSFELLVELIKAAPAARSAAQLTTSVWGAAHVSNETIAQRVTLLRKALGDDPKTPRYIRTVRGKGYAIIGKVAGPQTIPEVNAASRKGLRSRSFVAAVALGGVLAAVFLIPASPLNQSGAASMVAKAETDSALLLRRAQQLMSLHQAQETDRAIDMLREALTHTPDMFDTRLSLSIALSTKATKFLGGAKEEAEAEAIARALIDEQDDNSAAWSALGYTLSSQGRTDEALAAYRRAYTLDPDNAPALSSAAHLLLLKGDLQQALRLEVKAKTAGGSSRYAEIQMAQALDLIEHPAAEKYWSQALALNPGQAVVLKEVAQSLLRKGEPQAALDILAQYEGSDKSAPQILVVKGRALIALDRHMDARRILEQAGWRGHYGIAAIDALAGNSATAENLFSPQKRNALAADPDPELYIQLAEVSGALGRNDEALNLISQAVNLGWRDIRRLQHSAFLSDLMSSRAGLEVESRIGQELAAQRVLIENTEEIASILEK